MKNELHTEKRTIYMILVLEKRPFYARNAKMAGKGRLNDVIFLNCGHFY